MRRANSLRAALLFLLCGCAGSPTPSPTAPAAAALACAATSTKIVFGYQGMPAGRAPMATRVLAENGSVFLFVDDACNYWAYEQDFTTPAGLWTDVRTGQLTPDMLAAFNRELLVQPWSEFAEDYALGETSALWYGEHAFSCLTSCEGEARVVADNAGAWVSRLYAAGTAADEGSMRVEVVRYLGLPADYPFVEWTGTAELDTLVRTPEAAVEVGGRPLLDDSDSTTVRLLREPFRTGVHDTFSYQFLPISSGGQLFSVYARQTVPYEDAQGLIRGPGAPAP